MGDWSRRHQRNARHELVDGVAASGVERALYLHEVIDIVGRGAAPYMAHVARFDPEAVADRGLVLAGTWEVVGTTGRWPQVVNLWQVVDGWDGWVRLARRTNLAKADNAELAGWWDEAFERRSGGVDRLLASVPGAPDPTAEATAGRRGEFAVHELSEVRPGAGPGYLAALIEQWRRSRPASVSTWSGPSRF